MNAIRLVTVSSVLVVAIVLRYESGPVAAFAVWAACLAILARWHPQGLLSVGCLYLVLLGIFHLGLVLPVALGAGPADPPEWLESPGVGPALGLFAVAAAAFTLGTILVAPRCSEESVSVPPQRQMLWIGCVVACVGAAFLWTGVGRLGLFGGGYHEYFERAMTEDVRFFGFGMMLFPIGVLVAAVGATPRQMIALGAVLTLVLLPMFLHGFRGPMITQLVALLAVWARKEARVARFLGGLVLVWAVVFAPAIRLSRNLDQNLSETLGTLDPLAVLHEAGASLYPLVVTIDRVDSRAEPLWLGRSYAMGAGRVIPNVSSRWTAPSGTDLVPSSWATKTAEPYLYDSGGGIGFSGVAEPYLNFGLAGVLGFFFLLGFILRGWERALLGRTFLAAVGAASFGAVVWTVRNDAMELFRVVALAGVTSLGAWMALRLGEKRRSMAREVDETVAGVSAP